MTALATFEGPARKIGLADLAPDMCRWPVADRPVMFCGAPARAGGSSYCAAHHRRAYVETARRSLGASLPRLCEAVPPAPPRPVWQGPPAPAPLPEERAAIRVAPRQRRSGPPATPVVSAPRPTPAIMSMRGAATGRFGPAVWASPIATAPWLRVRLSPQAIIAMVARKAGITISEIKSARRHADLVLARRVAVVLLCWFTRLSLPQMGRALGGRDHTTIMHARDMARAAIGDRSLPDDISACADALFAALREGRAA